ncbi:hypothetical protein OAF71_00785 [bacterium]|nr:hypothetical protein [bacterium]
MYGFFQMVVRLLIEALPWLTELSASSKTNSGRTSPWSAGIGLAGEKLENLFSARLMSHFQRRLEFHPPVKPLGSLGFMKGPP